MNQNRYYSQQVMFSRYRISSEMSSAAAEAGMGMGMGMGRRNLGGARYHTSESAAFGREPGRWRTVGVRECVVVVVVVYSSVVHGSV